MRTLPIVHTVVRRGRTLGRVAFLLLVLAPPGANPHPLIAQIVDSAGIRIVSNPGSDRFLEWTFTEAFRLGGAPDGPEAFFRIDESTVATDASGRIYVLDRGNSRLVVFDSDGTHLRTTGRQGQGPGELVFAGSVGVSPAGEAIIYDFGRRSFVSFDAQGRHIDRTLVEGEFVATRVVVADGLVYSVSLQRPERGVRSETLIDATPDSQTIVSFDQPVLGEAAVLRSCGLALGGVARLFETELVWGARDNVIVFNHEPEYVVNVVVDGSLVRSVRRNLPPREATERMAREELGEGMRITFGGTDTRCDVDETLEERGFAPYLPWISALALAPGGWLWVRRREVGTRPAPIDLFDRAGIYVGTLPGGSPFPAAFLPDGRVVSIARDDLDVEYVVVWDVRR